MKDSFHRFAARISAWAGTATAFIGAILVVVIWAALGPATDFSDRWQLFINSLTTIVTFLMVFLIQNTQNRDGKAMQLKLDELILAHKRARESFIELESLSDNELAELDEQFKEHYEKIGESPALRKLHKHIAAEKTHRNRLVHGAEDAVGNFIKPFGDKN